MRKEDKVETVMIAAIVWILFFITWLFLFAPLANAHDSWINQGSYRNQAGEQCCGAQDCFPVEIESVPGGYRLTDTSEFIASSRVLPSGDGKAWRCHHYLNGVKLTRCLFIPMTTMRLQ